ncbi:MAG: 3-oxoacyl-[acyl-carrier-protein] synthase-3 [Flavobacteriales bacterium]|jgi:3-oxoacyl-[acyl-carrier-protein] synthase-3
MPSKITGSGHYIPSEIKRNQDFVSNAFYDSGKERIATHGDEIVVKFQNITGIQERRYAPEGQFTSDMATIAAQQAIEDSGIDPEMIDQIVVAHNFGDVQTTGAHTDMLPSLASRVKGNLNISNTSCVPYDVIFGCPGWIQGLIQAHNFIQAGAADICLIIGADTLSRKVDTADRDSMIFADGAGAVILQRSEKTTFGIIDCAVQSHTGCEVNFLKLGKTFDPNREEDAIRIKMQGRKIYEYALTHVPQTLKNLIDKAGYHLSDISKILLHQANEKMDHAIVHRLFELYDLPPSVDKIMPVSIEKLGNSSVATVPTLLSLIEKGKLQDHSIDEGDIIIFASVGAGMNINAVIYRYG